MRLHHGAAALALVGWYPMTPPIRCCSSKVGTPDYDFLCGAQKLEGNTVVVPTKCGAAVYAPVADWNIKQVYDSAKECAGAAPQVTVRDNVGHHSPPRCIPTPAP